MRSVEEDTPWSARLRIPAELNEEVAVAPKAAVYAEKLVVDAPPRNESRVVVALFGKR